MLRLIGNFANFICMLIISLTLYSTASTARDLPDVHDLKDYRPALASHLYGANGQQIGEYADQRRVFIPIADVPPLVRNAFIAAEDKNFYRHHGLDANGILRAAMRVLTGQSLQGGSTITQQVAKNILLTNERTFSRKINEAILATQMEKTFSKNHILELYLNEIYFGMGAYGIASAAETYFQTKVQDLTLDQAAFLAALPKGPENYNPLQNYDAALSRRNWVIDRMDENAFVNTHDADLAKSRPLQVVRSEKDPYALSAYFNEEVRQQVANKLGRDLLYKGGLSIQTTLDPDLQRVARAALQRELVTYDRHRGWRGPIRSIPVNNWQEQLNSMQPLRDVPEWNLAVVLETVGSKIVIGLRNGRPASQDIQGPSDKGALDLKSMHWALGKKLASEVLSVGDVVYVSALANGRFELQQVPKLEGALVALDPATGKVKALVGGFSFAQSSFNRATQAMRQPGSTFKPFVYAAALDHGYTPASQISNERLSVPYGDGQIWEPRNHTGRYTKFETLRTGLEKSLNTVTVRLAEDVGMETIAQYAERLGIYDHLDRYLPMALGTGETTLLRLTNAYGIIANGGNAIQPTFIDRILDQAGEPIAEQSDNAFSKCFDVGKSESQPPFSASHPTQLLEPTTAFQVTSMLQGVVKRGTGRSVASLGENVAAKSGTTNAAKDTWFIGFTPNLVTGVYIGFDTTQSMGANAWGSTLAAPVFKEFMAYATRKLPRLQYPQPADLQTAYVDRRSGYRTDTNDQNRLKEFFKPGTGPSEDYGESTPGSMVSGVDSPQAERLLERGQVGLF